MLKIFLVSFFMVLNAQAQVVSQEFKPSQLSFDFMSSEGSFWHDCTHVQAKASHDWIVTCQEYTFNLHLLLYEYIRPNEATYEFHYWADEVSVLKQAHTQSTWLTVDKEARAKRILAYLGFTNDAQQLRLEVKLK
jgi:hypothetical protein